jgi:mannose-6-phosphate isomerase-like protein (cupin superfamily)
MKFNKTTGYEFDRGDVKGFSFNTKDQFARMSAALFTCHGKHPDMKNSSSDRVYFVIEGRGEFNIDGEKFIVNKEEIIIVPKNTRYSYKGDMKCLLVNSPAFDREKEIIFNKNSE